MQNYFNDIINQIRLAKRLTDKKKLPDQSPKRHLKESQSGNLQCGINLLNITRPNTEKGFFFR